MINILIKIAALIGFCLSVNATTKAVAVNHISATIASCVYTVICIVIMGSYIDSPNKKAETQKEDAK